MLTSESRRPLHRVPALDFNVIQHADDFEVQLRTSDTPECSCDGAPYLRPECDGNGCLAERIAESLQ